MDRWRQGVSGYNVYVANCGNGNGLNQQWYFDDAGRLRSKLDHKCADYKLDGSKNVYMHECHGHANQRFMHPMRSSNVESGLLTSEHDSKCMDYNYGESSSNVYV